MRRVRNANAIGQKHPKSFDGVEVLKGISFDVSEGDVLAVIGPSGSGKSTPAALHQPT